jgi:hypothetical protein
MLSRIKNRYMLLVPLSIIFLFLSTGCDKISGLFNPFDGIWESGLFTLTLNPNKTFELQTGLGITLESEGTYKYDEKYLYLNFSGNHRIEFNYKLNDDKSELSLSPKTKSRLFKVTITFEKEED